MDLISAWMVVAAIGVMIFVLLRMMNANDEAFYVSEETNKKVGEIGESLRELRVKINKPSNFVEREPQPRQIGRPRGSKTMKGIK